MKIVNILKSNLAVTHGQGEKIRHRIVKKLYHGKKATIDCAGLICMTTNFIAPISELALFYSKDFLEKNVRFINISKLNATLLRRCIDNTLKLKENDKNSPE